MNKNSREKLKIGKLQLYYTPKEVHLVLLKKNKIIYLILILGYCG